MYTGAKDYPAFVHEENEAARRCLGRVGFVLAAPEPSENGYLSGTVEIIRE